MRMKTEVLLSHSGRNTIVGGIVMNNSMEKTQWMYERKFGVFFHHLEPLINNKNNIKSNGRETSWEAALRDFDFELFAAQLNEIKAGWCVVTIM